MNRSGDRSTCEMSFQKGFMEEDKRVTGLSFGITTSLQLMPQVGRCMRMPSPGH